MQIESPKEEFTIYCLIWVILHPFPTMGSEAPTCCLSSISEQVRRETGSPSPVRWSLWLEIFQQDKDTFVLTELPLLLPIIQDAVCCKLWKIQPNGLKTGKVLYVTYPQFQRGWAPAYCISNSVMSARAQALSITCLPAAVPSSLVAVVVRDTSSQRRCSWFTFSKRMILFPFVVLSLRGRWFFPQSLHWTSHISETDSTESHDHFTINPQKIGWWNSMNNLDKSSGLWLIWSISPNILDTPPQFYLLKYILNVFTSLVSKLP